MVQEGLEDREIAEVLVAEAVLELADFLRHIGLAPVMLDHRPADVPVKTFDLRLVGQVQHPQGEHVLGVLLALEGVVVGLQLVELGQVLADVEQLPHQRVLDLAVLEHLPGRDFFNGAKDLDDQHAVMRHHRPSALADDVRMRHLLGVADIGDVIDDVIGVFLEGVVGRAVKGGPLPS